MPFFFDDEQSLRFTHVHLKFSPTRVSYDENSEIQFQTREDFINVLIRTPNRLCEHIVMDSLNSELLALLIQSTFSFIMCYRYPINALTHVSLFFINIKEKSIYFFPDNLYKSSFLSTENIDYLKSQGYHIYIPALFLYSPSFSADRDSYNTEFQSDSFSCSYIAWKYGTKIERMIHQKKSIELFFRKLNPNFTEKFFLNEEILRLNVTRHQKQKTFEFTKNGFWESRPEIYQQVLFYVLPKNFLGISQRDSSLALNDYLSQFCEIREDHPLTPNIFKQQKRGEFQHWFQWSPPIFVDGEKDFPDWFSVYLDEFPSSANREEFFKQKTSPFRNDILFLLRQEDLTALTMFQIAVFAFQNMDVLPTENFLKKYTLITEHKINYEELIDSIQEYK